MRLHRTHKCVALRGGRFLASVAFLAVVGLPSSGAIERGDRAVERQAASEPALYQALVPAPAAGSFEWQYSATGMDRVPPSVLHAARGITIAIIDSGADLSAPDLAARGTSVDAYNVGDGGKNVADPTGHGTFVAALAGGSSENGDGIAGFGGEARLLIIKAVGKNGQFDDLAEAKAIGYAVRHGAKIINLSLAGTESSRVERRAILDAAKKGVLIVAAVGNDGSRGDPVTYPAALVQPLGSRGAGGIGLAVAASDINGAAASFSETGTFVSLAAPGQSVFGALSASSSAKQFPRVALPGAQAGLYGYASGTSFAAPEVAGAAALVWAADPRLTAREVAGILKETANGHGTWTPQLGFGVIDVGAAVARAQSGAAAA